MERSWWVRFLVLVTFIACSIIALTPTIFDFDEKSSWPVKSKINLGLDLQGGLYMVLGIDFKKVYIEETKNYAIKIKQLLNEEKIQAEVGEFDRDDGIDPKVWILMPSFQHQKAKDLIKKYYPGYLRVTGENNKGVEYALSRTIKTNIEEQSVQKSIEVIRNRIDEFGVTEPEIISQGNDRIIIQLPGAKDIERAKSLIGQTAKLEFKIVSDEMSVGQLQALVDKASDEAVSYKLGERFSDYLVKLNSHLKKELPKGYVIAFEKSSTKADQDKVVRVPFLVEDNVQLTGETLQDARVKFDDKNDPYVALSFKSKGAKLFEKVTGENVGKRMAIILDGNIYSAPVIQQKIAGGNASITLQGSYNRKMKEGKDLALVLRAGALPVQLDFLEQRTIGPSLGQDSIQKAKKASLIGIFIVCLFIIFYYKLSGLFAIITLSLNIAFVMSCLVAFEATLTLPGIAGIALTIGMAVDANIIIYERIREEVRRGLSNYKSSESGFNNAFWTIIDANITTALAGIALINFGIGPIRGFAVTLLIGIFATVYTSYFVGRIIFEYYMNKVQGQSLSI